MTKKPYALLINDIHVSKDNISEFQINWDEAVNICTKHHIQDIIVGGDLWQSRSAQTLSTLTAVSHAILKATSAGISVTLAEGNHDKVDQESYIGYNHLFVSYPGVEVVDDFVIWEISDETDLYVLSYFPETGSCADKIKSMIAELNTSKKNILYCHEGIKGGLNMPSDHELPSAIFKPFDAVLVGHYHDRKKIPGTNIEYIGASRQHNFGEDEEKGYTILFSDGSYEFVKNQANIRYQVKEIAISELTDSTLKELKQQMTEGGAKIKIKILCNAKEASAFDKQRLEGCATKVEFITEEVTEKLTESQSIYHKYNKQGIKDEYVSFCQANEITDIETGLHYLDKIN